ncbi:MAG TPA: alpha/beta hydrolase [Acidimicrobiia bacterium]
MRRVIVLSLVVGACSTATPATVAPAPVAPAPAAPAPAAPTTTTAPSTTAAPEATTSTAVDATIYHHLVSSEEYLPGLAVNVHAPAGTGDRPLIVLVHGGGWYGGDLDAMGLLADGLAERGAVVFNATYRRAAQGGMFPGPVDDVACAVAHAAATAGRFTTSRRAPVLIGHSAGAHLAALVTMAPPGTFGASCPEGVPAVGGFVGLAGPYNTDLLAFLLEPWFGANLSDDPDLWARGNPLTYAEESPDVPYLLIHGEADQLIPLAFTTELRDALAGAGRNVRFELIARAGHGEVNDPRVVGDLIDGFVGSGQ